VTWHKAEGDAVAVGDCVAEIETDKAVIDFTADAAGTLGRILVPAGEQAQVGTPVAVLLAPGETRADADALMAGQPATAAPATVAAPVAPAAARPPAAAPTRIFASPLARRLAAQAGLALDTLTGSGPHGRIIRRDVEAVTARAGATAQPVIPAAAAPDAGDARIVVPPQATGDVRVPHSAMRRTIARRLLESKTQIPHFYLKAQIRTQALSELRRRINTLPGERHVSVNDLIVKAVAAALVEVPGMNVSWTDDAMIQHAQADIAVAMSTPTGLITPVVRGVQDKSLSRLSAEIRELASRARAGRLQPQEYQGGSFTVSNLGMYGTTEFAAIINPPQSAILAVGAIAPQVLPAPDGGMEVAPVISVVLSVDHRAIDGAVASAWLSALRKILEEPLAALV